MTPQTLPDRLLALVDRAINNAMEGIGTMLEPDEVRDIKEAAAALSGGEAVGKVCGYVCGSGQGRRDAIEWFGESRPYGTLLYTTPQPGETP